MNTQNPRLEVVSTPLFKRQKGSMDQAVDICLYGSTEKMATVEITGPAIQITAELTPRRDHLFGRVLLSEITEPIEIEAQVTSETNGLSGKFTLLKKKKWRIHILHFSHTDTGYTDLPSRVARNHGRFLREILAYCRETDAYPEESRFRWTAETGYQFLNGWERLDDSEKLEVVERIKEGRIEIAPIYLAHTSELYDYEVLHRTLEEMTRFGKRHGITFTSGMNTDITGLPWGLVKVLASHGIKYLTTAVNATRGRAPDIPRPVWWEANDGSRVLLYNSDPKNAYIEGATMGFVDGIEKIADKLPRYLERYENESFPYDVVGFRTAGQNADNAGPVRVVPDIIKEWNENWDFPKAISSTNSAFLADMDANWGDIIPSTRKAWPDWWMDTFGTVAKVTSVCRTGHNDLWSGETMASVADALGSKVLHPEEEIQDALANLTLGDEIDTCASGGVSDPDSLQSQGQLHEQHAFGYKGAITGQEVHNIGRQKLFGQVMAESESVQVFNPASWTRDSAVEVALPKLFLDGKHPELVDNSGNKIAMQKLGEAGLDERFQFVAKELPPLGLQRYQVGLKEIENNGAESDLGKLENITIENDFYRINFSDNGTITELTDKEAGKKLAGKELNYGFNDLIYEETEGGRPPVSFERMMGSKTERTIDLNFMDYAHWMFPKRFPDRDTKFIRTKPTKAEVIKHAKGEVFEEITFNSAFGPVTRANRTIRLYHDIKRVDLVLDMDKAEVRDAEAFYVAFPFAMDDFEMEVENAYSFLTPESGQMPESSKDWYLAQRFIRIWDKDMQVIWSPLEAPLVQLGGIQTGRWLHDIELEKPIIMSWPMNNYWWTNVPASQGGWNYRFAYSLTSDNHAASRREAFQFGWDHHMPAEAHFSQESQKGYALSDALIDLSTDDVALTAFKKVEGESGLVMRLYEIAGKQQDFVVTWKGPKIITASIVDGADNKVKDLQVVNNSVKLEIPEEGILSIRLDLEKA